MTSMSSLSLSGLFSALPELGTPEFVDENFARDRYQCVKGNHLLIPPVIQLYCGHRLCSKPCLEDLRHSLVSRNCPGGEDECKEVDLTLPNHVYPDVGSTRELAKALVWCYNKNNGCDVQILWKDLENHLGVCEYHLVNCRYAENGCRDRKPVAEMDEHERYCLFAYMLCPHCSERVLKRDLENHKRECEIQQGRCLLSGVGCVFTATTTEELQDHLHKDVPEHLQLLCEAFEQESIIDKDIGEYIAHMKASFQSQLDEKLVDMKKTSKNVKQKLDPKLRNTQKVAAKNAENLIKLTKLEDQFKQLKPLQETAKVSESKLIKLEQDEPVQDVPPALSNTLQNIEQTYNQQDKVTREMDLKFQCVENTSYDGVFIWKVTGYPEHKQRARSSQIMSLYSQPFYTAKFGYKLCLRLYPNGDGMGKGSHISLYVVLMKGDMDALLPWPFKQKISFTLMDQDTHRRHFTDGFRPDPTSSSFHKPRSEMNIASGLPLFLEQSKVESSTYLKDDSIFIKVDIDAKLW